MTAAAPITAVLGRPESHARAVTKAVTWRVIGTADTYLWSWLITHQPIAAGTIASLETLTKIALYYLHERAWRLIPWAPNARTRSLIKSVSWRLVGSADTFILSMIVTGNAKYAVSIATAEAMTKIVLYYAHERVWRRVKWGRLEDPAASQDPHQDYEARRDDSWMSHSAKLREQERDLVRPEKTKP